MRKPAILLLIPLLLLALLIAVPSIDARAESSALHFFVVPAAFAGFALLFAVLALRATSIEGSRTAFIALALFVVAVAFALQGAATPGQLVDDASAAFAYTPWLGMLAAAVFATMSVLSLPKLTTGVHRRVPGWTFPGLAAVVVAYAGLQLALPNALSGLPIDKGGVQAALTILVAALWLYPAARYLHAYRLTQLPVQFALMLSFALMAEAQVALAVSPVWHISWWLYHGLAGAALATTLAGWMLEWRRAGSLHSVAETVTLCDAMVQLKRGRSQLLVSLANEIEAHDFGTSRHVDRLAAYSRAVGAEMGFGPPRLRRLTLAAELHDAGKLLLANSVRTNAGTLSEQEFALMRQHPLQGAALIRRVRGLEDIALTVRHHHEHFDGQGYPDGISGHAIPIEARIIAVADAFDAMCAGRPYRAPHSVAEARDELQAVAGTQLDPEVVKAFIQLLDDGRLVPSLGPVSAIVGPPLRAAA